MSVFYGGLSGAAMFCLFRALSRIIESQVTLALMLIGAVRIVARTLQGGLVAIMVILLSKVSTGAQAPITISIADFQGGVIAGLLSQPLVRWLKERLS